MVSMMACLFFLKDKGVVPVMFLNALLKLEMLLNPQA